MIYIRETEVYGFRKALTAMRNPMESWDKNDTVYGTDAQWGTENDRHLVVESPRIGPNDLLRLGKLTVSGTEHRKCLRTIVVWTEIEPNRYTWQEIDTYKVGSVRNSCSTMHKLGTRPLTVDDFQDGDVMPEVLVRLNELGEDYRATKNYDLVRRMKRYLPEGFLQTATYKMNYENALNMFFQRRGHRLAEWRWTGGVNPAPDGRLSICDWIYSLPYVPYLVECLEKAEVSEAETHREEGRREALERVLASLRTRSNDDELHRRLYNVLVMGQTDRLETIDKVLEEIASSLRQAATGARRRSPEEPEMENRE